METIALLQKLHSIHRAIDDQDASLLHRLVAEAEDLVRIMQRNTDEQRRRESRVPMQAISVLR